MLRFRTTEQSIDEGSQVQQILRSGYGIMAGPRLCGRITGHGIRPLDRNMATAAVRTQNEEEQGLRSAGESASELQAIGLGTHALRA